jgi:hypothetical protein
VIDTIGLNDKTYVDNYRTPHTEKVHVIERWKLAEGVNMIEVSIRVEDPDTFNEPCRQCSATGACSRARWARRPARKTTLLFSIIACRRRPNRIFSGQSSESSAVETPFFRTGRKRGLPVVAIAVRGMEKFAVLGVGSVGMAHSERAAATNRDTNVVPGLVACWHLGPHHVAGSEASNRLGPHAGAASIKD